MNQDKCMCTGCPGCSNEDLEPNDVELTTHVTVQIVLKIFEGQKDGLTDREIDEVITSEIGCLYYWQCALLDDCMFGEKERSYWRAAFDYPKDGDEVALPGGDGHLRGVAENCGFFTFGIRVIDEEESAG